MRPHDASIDARARRPSAEPIQKTPSKTVLANTRKCWGRQRRDGPYLTASLRVTAPSSGTLQTITACLCTLDWIDAGKAAAGGPLGRGVGCIWPRLNHLVALTVVVTMHRFLSDGVARKADCECDRSDKASHHGSMFPIENARQVRGHLHRATRPSAPVKSTEMRPSKRWNLPSVRAKSTASITNAMCVRAGSIFQFVAASGGDGVCETMASTAAAHRGTANIKRV
jgi:hypothetical protein